MQLSLGGHEHNPRISHRLPENQQLLECHAGHGAQDSLKLLQVAGGRGLHPQKPDEANPQDKDTDNHKAGVFRRAD